MKKIFHNKFLKVAWLLCAWLCTTSVWAQADRMYASGALSLKPGGETETQYFAIHLENASMDYVAYQLDIYLPEGLELAYYDGEPDIYIEDTSMYPTNRSKVPYHTLAIKVNDDFIRVICADIDGNRKLLASSGELFRVGVVPSSYLKPGDVKVALRNIVFSDINSEGPEFDSFDPTSIGTASATSTVMLKVSATNKFSTCILPFDAALPAGLEVYSCEAVDGDCLELTAQSSFKAFTPYIVYASNGFDGTLSGEVDAAQYQEVVTNGYLTGTVVKQEITDEVRNYVLQNQGEGPMFYRVGETSFAVPAGKCWLTLPASLQGVAALRLHRPTGIERIPVTTLHPTATYDLSGRRIAQPAKGVYIVGGKKVVK